MTVPTITAVRLTGAANRAELPLLVLGPSIGTTASTLWTECAAGLTDAFDVVAWDLPGHGYNHTVPDESFTMSELAQGVLNVLEEILEQRDQFGGSFAYAGDSVGGCVGLQLLLDHPGRVSAAVLLCTGAKIGEAAMWAGRIGQVSLSGTSVMVAGSAERWFGPGFLDRSPDAGSALLHSLQDTDDQGYIQVCQALAEFDVRDQLGKIDVPVLAVAGSADAHDSPGEPVRDRRGRAARAARRARGRRTPGTRRGPRRGGPADPASRSRRGRAGDNSARPVVRRGDGGSPRGAR